jgi:PAS domain S-box-containing protein
MPDDTQIDLRQTVAELRRQLDARTAERDEATAREAAIEERYALVTQAVAEGIYEWNIHSNSLWVSPRLIEIFGLAEDSLTAADWNSLVHPEDFPLYRAALRACFKGVTARLDCEYRVRHSDGQYRWIEDRGVPVRNASGRAVRLVGAVSDISARKSADEGLREALKQQTATTEVLEVINSSPGDLAPVFEAIASSAARLCNALNSSVYRYDGKLIHFLAESRFSSEAIETTQRLFPAPPSRDNATARAVANCAVVHIPDVLEDPDYRSRAWAEAIGLRSVVSVPMLRDGRPIGVITVNRAEAAPFPQSQVALLKTFADQAVIAIENTRLISETREALEQQTATAEVLQVINSSPGDLTPVFEAMLDKALSLCNAGFGDLATFDGVGFRSAVSRGYHPEPNRPSPASPPARLIVEDGRIIPDRPARPTPPIPGMALYELIHGEDIVHIADITDDEVYRRGNPLRRRLADEFGARTAIWVALRKEAELLGCFVIYRQEVRPFTDKEIALLQNFAAQAVIAMENARLLGELRERTRDLEESLEYQTATSDVLKVISRSTFDLQPVLDTLVETAARLCQAEMTLVSRREGEAYRMAANYGFPAEFESFLRSHPIKPDRGTMVGRVVLEGGVVHVADVAADPEYRLPEAVTLGKQRTALGVPLLREGQPIGVIVLARERVEPFTERQIELVRTFADQAVIAIENARLLTELRERTRDLEESLEYQTATSDVLKVISRSTFDLQPVLATVTETAARLCEAEMGFVSRRHGEEFRFVTAVGATAAAMTDAQRLKESFLDHNPFTAGRQNITGRVVLETRALQIADITADPEYKFAEAIQVAKIRTLLGVPMFREGVVVGTFSLARQRVGPFTERQIELVRTFADQAVIAIENTRLLTELRESLEQQQAIAEVLQVINRSPGDLTPVFEAMLERAVRLCESDTGHLFRFENGAFLRLASRGVSEDFDELFPPDTPVPLNPNSGPARMIATRSVVHLRDQREDESYRLGGRDEVAAVEAGIRTVLFVPLIKEGDVVGHFTMHRMEVKPFSDKQIALLQSFAAQAVIAMENARLLNELQDRTRDLQESLEYQTATSDVLKVISRSTFDLQPVLDAVVETAARLCEADSALISNREGEAYRVAATFSFSREYDAFIRGRLLPADRKTMTGRTVLAGRVVHIADIGSDPEYSMSETLTLAQIRTMLGVPLLREGMVVGTINLGRQRVEPFTERQIELVRTFADQAVIAIENTRLLTELRESLEQQQAIAEVLQVINSSPGDLNPVFDAMLDKALGLCGAAFGVLWTYDGERVQAAAVRGAPPAFEEFLTRATHPVGPNNAHGRLLRGEPVVHIADVAQDEAYRSGDPVRRNLVELGGGRALLAVPLRKEGAFLGDFVIYRQEVRPFTDRQIALLQSFAAQAVIAIDNAQLLEEIRQRQAELRVTFDNMGDGVAMFDAELRLAAWNRNFQQILDLPEELLAGQPSLPDYIRYLLMRGEYGDVDVEGEVRRLVEAVGREWSTERARPDGRVIEVRANPVPGGGIVLIYSDITERKRAEAEIRAARDAAERALAELQTAQASLLHAQKMAALGQLTAGIAHEIKNPLNFVNNFADLSVELLDELKETAAPVMVSLGEDTRAEIDETIEMLTGNLEKIAEHGRRADGIVKSMLAHSRGGSGDWQSVDLNALVEEALNLAYHGARAQDQSFNITMERDFDAAIAPIELVPQDVTRVFLNLFGNGFYAADKRRREAGDSFRPVLKVTTRGLGDAIEVTVRDNGIGVAPEVRERLFQPFFTTKPTGEGTGLGLSISYDIVTQQHGGTIDVDSRVGEFTEFTIRLPRSRRAASAGRAQRASAS